MSTEMEKLQKCCDKLIAQQQTLLLATVTREGQPEASYAPYVRDDAGVFYIFVSELAAHTRNLLEVKTASVLFIQDERESRNLFARERLTLSCEVSELERSSEQYAQILDQLHKAHGETVALLRTLPDFHLFALRPVAGNYVLGFGQAYELDPASNRLKHLRNPAQLAVNE